MSDFSINVSRVPALPVARTIRTVIADLESGRLDTNTRYGRKHMWKSEESERYIHTLLKGDTLTDPISIGRHTRANRIHEPAINGNNRLRSLRRFANNQIGVRAEGLNGKMCTYYYSEIPPMEVRAMGRVRPHVLSPDQRNAFDEYPVLFNCRPDLTEREEIAWYRELNTSLHAHTTGHLLVADIVEPTSQVGRNFADALITHLPAVKDRISEPAAEGDVDSLGTFLTEVSQCDANFLNDDDKRENVLLSHAVIMNLLVNGLPFKGEFKGVFSSTATEENVASMRKVFADATLSDELRMEWISPVKSKAYMKTFHMPSYLLGPIAWSIGTRKENAVAVWTQFLSSARPGTIAELYGNDLADLKYDDANAAKYKFAWDRVVALNA